MDHTQGKTEWAGRAMNIVKEWREEIKPLRESNDKPIRPERLCKEISDLLPENAILVADTGYAAIWTSNMIQLSNINQLYLRAAGSLGWAFPASLGAKCAAMDRPVICFTGDGGFWYHIAELETAKRWNLNTITIVNNNSAFGQSIVGIEKAYGNKNGNRDEVYGFRKVNFAKIAEEIGCLGIRVEDPNGIGTALKKAFSSNVPAVIDVVTDRMCKPDVSW
ncbi:Pyruvate dehydrogenase [ubiquinone] [subsurface metagenome]